MSKSIMYHKGSNIAVWRPKMVLPGIMPLLFVQRKDVTGRPLKTYDWLIGAMTNA